MVNHVRTLLLNRSGTPAAADDDPGEEYVPSEYRAVTLPSYLRDIRRCLFGAAPDRLFLNYRLRQMLTAMHACEELEGFIFDLDPRITYAGHTRLDLLDQANFTPRWVRTTGDTGTLYLQGVAAEPDANGQTHYAFEILLETSTVTVTQLTPNAAEWTFAKSIDSGLTPTYQLGDSGYGFKLDTAVTGTRFSVELSLRPQWGFGQLLALLQQVGEPTLLSLFGAALVEPYRTFRNLFFTHPDTTMRLGGAVLAAAYRTEEVRRQLGGTHG